MKKYLSAFAVTVGLLLGSAGAYAIPVNWTLSGVSFADGTNATGSFTYDASTNLYSDWNINVDVAAFLPAFNYLDGAAGQFLGIHNATAADFVALPPASPGRYIRLTFASALTDLGGSVALALGGASFECNNCSQQRRIVSGSVTTRVPEPVTLALLSMGLLGIGLIRLRRQ